MSNDLNVSDEEWARRQIAAGGPPLDSERMYPQEIVFLERAQKRGEIMEWIPTGKDGVPRNDFKWISRNGIPAELKSPAGTKYKNIAKRISDAVATAKEHGVTKNVFVVDFGDAKIPDKLIRQLSRYNENHANKITELWIWDSAGLRQLKL
ncbi:hypothetical protein [Bifidobacterium jacchi]|uniref:tRNA nuclease CdiA C-terminal domain-containing protein n=1 Tax=Bifidobacterium jacchi TaxID=2490545 RepID=A0A5N5RHE5_9BIFI|nr:hypothetical protein [Bifidobacterium jacchi]KAB5606686.1 hypothetical protein EHS19_06740 [Bifidobacterium jacchi]